MVHVKFSINSKYNVANYLAQRAHLLIQLSFETFEDMYKAPLSPILSFYHLKNDNL